MKTFSFLTVVSVLCASVALAEPTVTLSRVQQRYPWNGLVDIDYTVAGMDGNPSDYTLTFTASLGDETVTMKTFDTYACCDLPMTNGSYHLVWDAKADGHSFSAANVAVQATLAYAPVAEGAADFMIIDLSAGTAKDATYPVRYVASNVVDAAQFAARDLYKTTKLVLRRIPPQTFFVGDGGDRGNVESVTSNRRKVTLTKGSYLGLFEVTQAQYILVCGALPYAGYSFTKAEDSPMRPAGWVSYAKAMKNNGFVSNLVARAICGTDPVVGFDLPTEMQWECACRAGSLTAYHYGSNTAGDILPGYAWYSANATELYDGKSQYTAHAVGTREPNAWGFYDMYGNNREWCRDWYVSAYPDGDLEDYEVTDETLATPLKYRTTDLRTARVIRGGCYSDAATAIGSGKRLGIPPDEDFNLNGNCASENGIRISLQLDGTEADVSPAPVVVSAPTLEADFDFGTGVFAPLTLDNVYPFAWNSAADWAMGGDTAKAVTVTVTPLSGDPAEDLSTWTASGAAVVLVDASTAGAGLATWTPERRSLYRADLTVGGAAAGVRYFNLNDTEGFAEGTSLAGGTLQLTLGELPYTGLPLVPETVVTVGDKVLVKNVDYTVSCANNVELGTATVTVTGLGDYKDSLTTTFTIVDPVRSVLAESEAFDGPIVDVQPGCANCWVFRNPTLALPIAWNDGETFPGVGASVWPIGGTGVEGVLARVSIAPLAEAGGEAGAYTVLGEMSGEGVIEHTFSKGFWRLKLEVSDDQGDFSKSSALTGDVWIKRDATGLQIFIR